MEAKGLCVQMRTVDPNRAVGLVLTQDDLHVRAGIYHENSIGIQSL